MSQVGELSVRIGADTRGLKKGLSEIDSLSKGTVSSMAAVKTAIAGAFTVSALTMFTKHLIDVSDTYTQLNGRLALVTKSTQELETAQNELYEIAKKTRVEYESTVDLFTRMARSTDQLGISQADLLQITESINKALVVSGASGESASAALMQLGQGFASGTLRGEELNSVLEQTPRLAQMIADGMGITIGQLRQYGQEGMLSAEAVTKAILSQGEAINAEFSKMPVTVGQAMTNLNTVWESIVSGGNEATGATNDLADAITSVATTIEQNKDGIIAAMAAIGETAGWLIERIANIGNAIALMKAAGSGNVSWTDAATASPADAKKLLAGVSPTAGHTGSWGGGATGGWGDEPQESTDPEVPTPTKVTPWQSGSLSLDEQMDDLRKSLATEAEIEEEAYAKRLKLIEDFYKGRADLTTEDDELRAKVAADHEERMAEINGIPAMERKLEDMQDSFKTERELELERYQEKLYDLQEFLDNSVASEEQARDLKIAIEEEFQERLRRLKEKEVAREQRAKETIMSMRMSVAQNTIALLQKVFGDQKALAVAAIALDTMRAVTQNRITTQQAAMLAYASQLIPGDPTSPARAQAAYSYTQGLGAVNEGLIIAAGVASGISAMKGSGGSSSALSSPGFGAAGSSVSSVAPAQEQSRTLTIYGIDRNSLVTYDQIDKLAKELTAYAGDGGTVVNIA